MLAPLGGLLHWGAGRSIGKAAVMGIWIIIGTLGALWILLGD